MTTKLKCYFCDKDINLHKKHWGKADISDSAWLDKDGNICEPIIDDSDSEFYKYICCNKCDANYVLCGRVYRLVLDKRWLRHLDILPDRAFRILKRGKVCK